MAFPRHVIFPVILLGVIAGVSTRVTTRAQSAPSAFANFEEAQTNPVRLSADGTILFAVNTPNASLSVFDVTTPGSPSLLSEIPVGLGPVSVNPRTDDEVWVVNQVSNSVSVVSVSQGIVVDTISVKPEPMDVVFAGSQAYISVSRANAVVVVDTSTHAPISTLPVFGGSPRALAVSPTGSTVYAAFAIAGNATTVIPANLAPVQCGVKGQTKFNPAQCVPAFNPALPTPPEVALIVAATDPDWSSDIKYKMPDNGVVAINTGATPSVAGYYSGVGTINLGLAVNPVSGDLYVANTAALNLTSFEPNLDGHWVNNQITRIQVASGTVTPFNLNPNVNYSILPNPAALSTALAQPAGVVFDPSGNFMYVASFGTDRVAQVSTSGNVNWFVEVNPQSVGSAVSPTTKRGPRGLALNSQAQTLYSLNRISNTISVIDTGTKAVTGEIAVGADPTPSLLKAGRGFLYDAKLSGNGMGACASCHVDGDMDHLAWNLGNPAGSMTSVVQNGVTIEFHPMKGPMTTQTLRGLLNLSPYHWRGDMADFAAFNVAFNELMGGAELSDPDMALYTNFANSILFLPNPNENLDRTLPTSLNGGDPATGQTDFLTIDGTGTATMKGTCNQCHTSNNFGPGSDRVIQTAGVPDGSQPLKVPELRNIYQKLLFNTSAANTIDGFGLGHDGSFPGLLAFLSSPLFSAYTAAEKTDIIAYSVCFDTGTAPAVGYTITLTAATIGNSTPETDWTTLQSQASAGNIDLIGRGTIKGQLHGLLYQPTSNNYISDAGVVYTQAQLQALIGAGDTLSFMGVYPGTGSASSQP
ncbi:MAG TPA: YncE family protein [Bryobacteraceae bacterium]|nr:YncE family protein [Bryobacteraceae bacterium]